MSFRLDVTSSLGHGVSQALDDCCARAISGLASEHAAAGLHAARKALKRLRTLLLLCDEMTATAAVDAELACTRQLRQSLGPWRDQDALSESWQAFSESLSPAERELWQGFIAERLKDELGSLTVALKEQAETLRQRTTEELVACRSRLRNWQLADQQVEAGLAVAVRRARRQARRRLAAVARQPDLEALHACRKSFKHYGYIVEGLEGIWAETGGPQRRDLKEVAAWLGQDRDLAALEAWLRARVAAGWNLPAFAPLCAAFAARRSELQTQVFAAAPLLLAAKPKGVAKRLAAIWGWRRVAVAPATLRPPAVARAAAKAAVTTRVGRR